MGNNDMVIIEALFRVEDSHVTDLFPNDHKHLASSWRQSRAAVSIRLAISIARKSRSNRPHPSGCIRYKRDKFSISPIPEEQTRVYVRVHEGTGDRKPEQKRKMI